MAVLDIADASLPVSLYIDATVENPHVTKHQGLPRLMPAPLTPAQFIEKAKERHPGAGYDYAKTAYRNFSSQVTITCPVHGDFEQKPSKHLAGQGCRLCGIERRGKLNTLTQDAFIAKARARHPDAGYSYDKVVYTHTDAKVTITCLVHGDFQQTPNDHLTGRGCMSCGIERRGAFHRSSLADFISKARLCHPLANYGYDKFVYVNSLTKGVIACPIHGDFEQSPGDHLSGHGCRPCGSARVSASKMATQEEFIASAKVRHPDAGYGYDKVTYVDSHTQVTITCPSHGDFEQVANSHLAGRGCPRCGWEARAASNTYTQDEFIARAKAEHPCAGYGYDKVAYSDCHTQVTITCPVHGDFTQKPSSHLNGSGCQACSGRISRISTAWLDDLGITIREHLIWIPGRSRPLAADGYDPKTNTVYEFLGDYFHGNPAVYDPDAWISKSQRVTYGQRHERLMRKVADLRSAGYNVVTIWERDFRALNEGRTYHHDPKRSRGPSRSKSPGRPPRPPLNSQSDLFG